MADAETSQPPRILEPMDRISEVLFGLIMVLTFTCTLAVATATQIEVRTMLIGALGCNVAWGIIDGAVYLLTRFNERGHALLNWRAVRDAVDPGAAQRIIANALPPLVAAALEPAQLEHIRQKLCQSPEPPRPHLTRTDWLGAAGICLLSFLSTFPVVIPFLLFEDTRLALRVSNAVAIAMLFLCGFMLGRYAGFRPVPTGLFLVAFGSVQVAVAIALGG
jgi:hypothetical protein